MCLSIYKTGRLAERKAKNTDTEAEKSTFLMFALILCFYTFDLNTKGSSRVPRFGSPVLGSVRVLFNFSSLFRRRNDVIDWLSCTSVSGISQRSMFTDVARI